MSRPPKTAPKSEWIAYADDLEDLLELSEFARSTPVAAPAADKVAELEAAALQYRRDIAQLKQALHTALRG